MQYDIHVDYVKQKGTYMIVSQETIDRVEAKEIGTSDEEIYEKIDGKVAHFETIEEAKDYIENTLGGTIGWINEPIDDLLGL